MGKWNWLLIILGVLLILFASFSFPNELPRPLVVGSSENMSSTETFQIILGIAGLAAAIWGIIKE